MNAEQQSQQPQPDETDCLYTGILPKTGQAYDMRYLGMDDIHDIMALQDKVYADLSESEKNFIVYKDEAFFERHFSRGHPMIGAFVEGQLVAQSIIRAPSSADRHIGMTDMVELQELEPENITILQGVLCSPDYRGNGLMNLMVEQWLSWAQEHGRHNALAEIEVRNHFSWQVFMKQGMELVSMGRDENDGARLYNAFQDLAEETGKVKYRAMKRLSASFSAAAMYEALQTISIDADSPEESAVECARNDLPLQHKLMKAGFSCSSWDKTRGVMHYKRRS
jgi:RimJ/RimL family protein N-acetyltransferase